MKDHLTWDEFLNGLGPHHDDPVFLLAARVAAVNAHVDSDVSGFLLSYSPKLLPKIVEAMQRMREHLKPFPEDALVNLAAALAHRLEELGFGPDGHPLRPVKLPPRTRPRPLVRRMSGRRLSRRVH